MAHLFSPHALNLNDNQKNAREFWNLSGSGSLVTHCAYDRLLNLHQTYGPNDFSTYQSEMTKLLTSLGFPDMDTLSEQFEEGLSSEIGYWFGSYVLFDEKRNRYGLVVGRDTVTLILPATNLDTNEQKSAEQWVDQLRLSNFTYHDGLLNVSNDHYSFDLKFSLLHGNDMADTTVSVDDFPKATQPRCKGSVTIKQDGTTPVQLEITGKKGSYTHEGVTQMADGDPISTWTGSYRVIDTTHLDKIQEPRDPITIGIEDGEIQFQWGDDIFGENVQFNNNILLCSDDGDTPNHYTVAFSCGQDGRKRLDMVISPEGFTSEKEDIQRYLVGFLDDKQNGKNGKIENVFISTSSLNSYQNSNSVFKKSIGWSASDVITLPVGVPLNSYSLELTVEGAPEGDYTWSFGSKGPNGTIIPQQTTTIADLTLEWAAADLGVQTFTLILTSKKKGSKSFTFSVSVENIPPITLSPTTLTVYEGNLVDIIFSANGGKGLLKWQQDSLSVPPDGLTFYPDTQKLTGTVKVGASSRVSTLLLVVSTRDDIMLNPGQFSINITVLDPSKIDSTVKSSNLALAIIGSVFGLFTLGKGIYEVRKAWQKNAGDPTFDKTFTRTSLVGTALKASVEGLTGKKYTHNIEMAVDFDVHFPDRAINFKGDSKLILEHYNDLIKDYNNTSTQRARDLSRLKRDLAVEKQRGHNASQREIRRLERAISVAESNQDLLKAEYDREIYELGETLEAAHSAEEAAKAARDARPFHEKAWEWLRR